MPKLDRKFSIAPMMDWTDRHDRFFLRLISRHVLLYTEMVTTPAILHGKRPQLLGFDPSEHPIALQLGGSNPKALAECAKIGTDWGYDEININVGCPSDRVQEGRFGACLMAEPELVAECVAAMKAQTDKPITVKHRIGIDDKDSWEELVRFVEIVAAAGCETFIVHARKAWLSGLSPKENREIPPLKYEVVYALKKTFPQLEIIINGGVTTLDESAQHLQHVDGVMIGREAYHNPFILAEIERRFYDADATVTSRAEVLQRLLPYVERELAAGNHLTPMTRHILGLFQGLPGARAWRRHISEHAHVRGAGIEVIRDAAAKVGIAL